jgi:hypothetical protein
LLFGTNVIKKSSMIWRALPLVQINVGVSGKQNSVNRAETSSFAHPVFCYLLMKMNKIFVTRIF